MPISVVCPSCGKGLKVPDDWAGKRGKCPQCMTTFPIPAGGAKPVASASPAEQAAERLTKRKRVDRTDHSSVSIAWGPILLGLLGLLILGSVLAIVFGPVRVHRQWKTMDVQARHDIIDVTDFSLKSFMSTEGYWNPRKGNAPSSQDVTILFSPWSMSMPDSVPFRGETSEGGFKGAYRPADGEVEAEMQVGGAVLAGHGVVREGNVRFAVKGTSDGKTITATVNGKPASIYYPPRIEEEE